MNILDLTPQQLKRAASIKEQIEGLNKELAPASRRLDDQWRYIKEAANERNS